VKTISIDRIMLRVLFRVLLLLLLLLIYHSHGIKLVAHNLSLKQIGHHIHRCCAKQTTRSIMLGSTPYARSKPDTNDSNDSSRQQTTVSHSEKENDISNDSKEEHLSDTVTFLIGLFAPLYGVISLGPNGMMSDPGTPRALHAAKVGTFASLLFIIGGISFAAGTSFGLWTLVLALTLQIIALVLIGN
jgi:hypothetical protein